MVPYKITIEYDGSEFFGFQRQNNFRTVQDEIEKALKALGWGDKSILFAGRTDSGVHAEEQVVAFSLNWQHDSLQLMKAINDHLPSDVSVLQISECYDGFHPRFDAKERYYRYQIYVNETRRPLFDRYYWRIWPAPHRDIIEEASREFVGQHDFQKLGCKVPDDNLDIMRTVSSIDWLYKEDNKILFFIRAQSFLYHMVRRIVFILIKAGQNKIQLSEIQKGDLGFSELPAGIAPARGLFLEKVIY